MMFTHSRIMKHHSSISVIEKPVFQISLLLACAEVQASSRLENAELNVLLQGPCVKPGPHNVNMTLSR